MAARRIAYITLLILAAVLHYAYGQYVTFYMVIFLLLAALASLILSIPAARSVRITLEGGGEVPRGRKASLRVSVESGGFLKPEAVFIRLRSENLFTGGKANKKRVRLSCAEGSRELPADASRIGVISFEAARAYVFDRLGLFPIPVKKSGKVFLAVLPEKERPEPEPELTELSAGPLRPKPQSFSEEHELRPYRGGDPMNLVHWKLTRKMGNIIVREPQEIARREIVLLADLPEGCGAHESVLGQLMYLSEKLLGESIPFTIRYGSRSFFIDSENGFSDFLRGVLSEPMRTERALPPDTAGGAVLYRVTPGKEARDED
jgi:uncharacterized protein (DUF58 family)